MTLVFFLIGATIILAAPAGVLPGLQRVDQAQRRHPREPRPMEIPGKKSGLATQRPGMDRPVQQRGLTGLGPDAALRLGLRAGHRVAARGRDAARRNKDDGVGLSRRSAIRRPRRRFALLTARRVFPWAEAVGEAEAKRGKRPRCRGWRGAGDRRGLGSPCRRMDFSTAARSPGLSARRGSGARKLGRRLQVCRVVRPSQAVRFLLALLFARQSAVSLRSSRFLVGHRAARRAVARLLSFAGGPRLNRSPGRRRSTAGVAWTILLSLAIPTRMARLGEEKTHVKRPREASRGLLAVTLIVVLLCVAA